MKESRSFSIKSWAEGDRPREKLLLKGKATLSNAELIAILIGSGSAQKSAVKLSQEILAGSNNRLQQLGKLSVEQLKKFKGIGEAKAITIIAAMELGRRRRGEAALTLKNITSSQAVFEVMQPLIGELSHEEFWVLYLSNSNKILRKKRLSEGGMTGTIVDPKKVYKHALEYNARNIILAHNHPSGNLSPSHSDQELTQKLKDAGEFLDIKVLDHLIVTQNSYFSFADEGLL